MNLKDTKDSCLVCLNLISTYFEPECKLTLVVRKPGNEECDFVLSNDNKEEVIKALNRRL